MANETSKRGRPRLAICLAGLHPMTDDNRLRNGGCRACNNARTLERKTRLKVELKLQRIEREVAA